MPVRSFFASDPAATPEEAAAIAAAIELFVAETTPPAREAQAARNDGWREAALLEGVSRDPGTDAHTLQLREGWINT